MSVISEPDKTLFEPERPLVFGEPATPEAPAPTVTV